MNRNGKIAAGAILGLIASFASAIYMAKGKPEPGPRPPETIMARPAPGVRQYDGSGGGVSANVGRAGADCVQAYPEAICDTFGSTGACNLSGSVSSQSQFPGQYSRK